MIWLKWELEIPQAQQLRVEVKRFGISSATALTTITITFLFDTSQFSSEVRQIGTLYAKFHSKITRPQIWYCGKKTINLMTKNKTYVIEIHKMYLICYGKCFCSAFNSLQWINLTFVSNWIWNPLWIHKRFRKFKVIISFYVTDL